ncbi:CRISPR-associated protein Cas4 [Sphingomonas sp.]|uniref:CRISPR-associated protein Cas4 n=1 Tax=Sphingomonas sp. TaxID=28214 RepID=UPI002C8B5D86|nr:CRISPR-associated protein Cas4 [Sphingomonas sp.]HTG39367.1 CRISPR-associated protein Cas4 [Sphingomonas sp.]
MTSAAPAPAATDEDALVPISALQHQLFCPRQCALIHLEQQWLEDGATAEGRILHERVDGGGRDQRRGARTVRGLSLRSLALGVTGKADAVELHGSAPDWRPYPIEYKRGKPKAHRADEVQLCAQAICLEEMFGCAVPEGALFYGATHRRMAVAIDDDLRALTAATADAVRAMLASGRTPPPVAMPACARCSLEPLCQPKAIEARPRVSAWLARQIAD